MKKLFFLIIIISLMIFGASISPDTKAGVDDNISGWAWSETIGWISFNCTNQGTCGTADYGVDIDDNTGEFSGHAWSENIGWISFNRTETGSPPAQPYKGAAYDYIARVDLESDEVSGWARALAHGDGWDGWIKMRDGDYGVSIGNGEFSGWAWGGDPEGNRKEAIVGWISFNCEDQGVCGISDYKVVILSTFFNQPPDKPGIPSSGAGSGIGGWGWGNYSAGEEWNHCSIRGLSIPTLHWTYFDPDGDPQLVYEIRIDDDTNFTKQDPEEFTGSGGAATAYAPVPADWRDWMEWKTNYWWIVRVKDDQGNWSEWSDANKFRTPNHAYPWSAFSWLPEDPDQEEVVIFDPEEEDVFYFWTVTEGEEQYTDGTGPTNEEPHIKFLTSTNKIKLKVTDADAYSCESDEQEITAQLPLPEYEEVPPIIWLKQTLAALVSFFNGFLSY